jgi:hypothetical protein
MNIKAGRAARIALLVGVAATAAGCSTGRAGLGSLLGITKSSPDPFNVYPHEPLVLPSDLTALPPPQPGAPSPREPKPQATAQAALGDAGAPVAAVEPGAGEAALLAGVGADAADPTIRDALVNEAPKRESKYGLTSLFGYKVPDGSEEDLLEAREERKRLLEEGAAAPNPPPEVVKPSNVLF